MNYFANLFIISSPSGAGKSTLLNKLFSANLHPMKFSRSHTTRDMRPGEIDGVHYHFVTKEKFREMIDGKCFFEWAQVFDNYYGTSRVNIEEYLKNGTDVFLDIDWQGARQIRKQFPAVRTIFILPPSLDVLRNRLVKRGQDSDQVINSRMDKAKNEIIHYDEYDYTIINDDLETAFEQLKNIVLAERQKTANQMVKNAELLKNLTK
jgi:guanylate kinase